MSIAPILVGSYTVVAVAVDNVGGMKASASVHVHRERDAHDDDVCSAGLTGYAGASDTYLDGLFSDGGARGVDARSISTPATYRPLVRFAIFQSEGGPVPNGAVIQSATLALYKQAYDDTLQLNALLKPWVEARGDMDQRQTGVPWTVAGAAGAGTDYNTIADARSPPVQSGLGRLRRDSRVRQWTTGGPTTAGS